MSHLATARNVFCFLWTTNEWNFGLVTYNLDISKRGTTRCSVCEYNPHTTDFLSKASNRVKTIFKRRSLLLNNGQRTIQPCGLGTSETKLIVWLTTVTHKKTEADRVLGMKPVVSELRNYRLFVVYTGRERAMWCVVPKYHTGPSNLYKNRLRHRFSSNHSEKLRTAWDRRVWKTLRP